MRRAARVASAFLLAASSLAAQSPRRADAYDAIRLRRFQDLAWSPDGARVAFVVVSADSARRRWLGDVWIADRTGARPIVTSRAHDRAPRWSLDGRSIAFLSDADSGVTQIWTVPADGGAPTRATRAPESIGAFDWTSDGLGFVFTAERGAPDDTLHVERPAGDPIVSGASERVSHLWRADVTTGALREIAHVTGSLSAPRSRPRSGDVLVERRPTARENESDLSDLLLVRADGSVLELTADNPGTDADAMWDPTGSRIVYLSNAPNDNILNVAVRTPGGAAQPIASLSGFDPVAPQFLSASSPRGAMPAVGAIIGRGLASRFWQASGDSSRALTGDSIVVLAAAWSVAGGHLATVESSRGKPAEVVIRWSGGAPTAATSLNSVPFALGETRPFSWRSRDGLELQGVLVLPPGYRGGKIPTLVRVHGGPYGRYDLGFDAFAQFVAGKGYALFEPNYRGSEGRGEEFSRLIRGDYGGRNHEDILDGVDALVAAGIADSARLGIFGWSFGGYSTNWMVTQTNRFDAGVAGAGMSNMLSHYGTSDIQRYREYMSHGAPWDSSAAAYLWKRSPLRAANQVRTPLLLLHGESDRRVATSQSEEMLTALRRLGATVELVRYPREPHSFREPLHQVDRDRRIVEWFDRWVK